MAITKTHPIKSTLKAAIDYICNPVKTDGKLLVSSYGCAAETADIEFAWTRRHAIDKGTNLGRLVLDVALALVLSGDDDGQSMLFTDTVAGTADVVIAPLVGMVVLVIREADRIENQVVMDVILVYVGGQYELIFTAQDFFCKLHPDLMGFLRRHLPRLKCLDQMAAQVGALVDGMAAGPGKLNVRCFGSAAIGGHQQFSIRLFGIADIVNGRFQR